MAPQPLLPVLPDFDLNDYDDLDFLQRSSVPNQATMPNVEQPIGREERMAGMRTRPRPADNAFLAADANDSVDNDPDLSFWKQAMAHEHQITQAQGSYPPLWYEEPDSDRKNLAEGGESVSYTAGEHNDATAPLDQSDLFEEGLNSAFGPARPSANTTAEVNSLEEGPVTISVTARKAGRAKILKNRKRNKNKVMDVVDEYDTYAELQGFEPSTYLLPKEVSLQKICEQYPNHLVGPHLDAFIQYMWTGLDIYNILPPRIVNAFIEAGVMSSERKNRANFLTKRLNKRINFHTPESMTTLIEAHEKLRPCMDNGKVHYGRSKLQGKYSNSRAQAVRPMPPRKYNGMSSKKRKAAAEEEVDADEVDNDGAEPGSEPSDQLRDSAQSTNTAPHFPYASFNDFDVALNEIDSMGHPQFVTTDPEPSAHLLEGPNFDAYDSWDQYGYTGFPGGQDIFTAGEPGLCLQCDDGEFVDDQFAATNAGMSKFQPIDINGGMSYLQTVDFIGGMVNFQPADLTADISNFPPADFNGGTVNFQPVDLNGELENLRPAFFNGGMQGVGLDVSENVYHAQRGEAIPHETVGHEVNGGQSAYPIPHTFSQVMPQSVGRLGKRAGKDEADGEVLEIAGGRNKRVRYEEGAEAPPKVGRPSRRSKCT
ncbi:uncharacterized protein A1O9_08782 [Exophiala aquamarina CBS 119918]|uniref:Uncharacterized protein n=1 Tax=Exophiala aquamarina CBS 119918 TaxID=1182545 RepID=A0A072P4T4_9EURO|nr:uncharacterized protein A1O9_08782 [Exophiala aquamarina CBS 119918]KEF55129.1 hypothetical protein A1O9_08782 [Exophiala aquamarina CBS 119918]